MAGAWSWAQQGWALTAAWRGRGLWFSEEQKFPCLELGGAFRKGGQKSEAFKFQGDVMSDVRGRSV